MSDINTMVIQPLKEFAKSSVHLVKKCTKPDRKGKLLSSRALILSP
jgi:protein transport protein SEC61 subunit gamma-like protein